MTALALSAVLTQMLIVLGVTRNAVRREFDFMSRLLMAAGASDFAVRAGEGEASFLSVVELPNIPAVRVVAVDALFAQGAFVYVVALMTAATILRDAFVARAHVTLHAGNGDVQSKQRKAAQIVIKRDFDSPALALMTLLAVFAELA